VPPQPPAAQVRELTPAEVEKDKGNAAVKAGDWEAAAQHYTVALKMEPGLLAALNNRSDSSPGIIVFTVWKYFPQWGNLFSAVFVSAAE
jgi:hypothetical protein